MIAELPERARERWDVILRVAEQKKPGLADALRRQLPELVASMAEEALNAGHKPWAYAELFWYYVHRKAWYFIRKYLCRISRYHMCTNICTDGKSDQSVAAFQKRWEWSLEDQKLMISYKPGCYQYMDAFFRIRARITGNPRPARREKASAQQSEEGPPSTISNPIEALDELTHAGPVEGASAEVADLEWRPAAGKELLRWENWPSPVERRSIANKVFPARHPEEGLEYFEFSAPAFGDWAACFGGTQWEQIRSCLHSAAADLGGCLAIGSNLIYPLRITLQLRGGSNADGWSGVMRFGWDVHQVNPLHPHFQAMIKFAYETLMMWHLKVLQGELKSLDQWTSAMLGSQIRRPNAVWGDIEQLRETLKLRRQAEVAKQEKHSSAMVEREVFSVDHDYAQYLVEENMEYIRYAGRKYVAEQREKGLQSIQARD